MSRFEYESVRVHVRACISPRSGVGRVSVRGHISRSFSFYGDVFRVHCLVEPLLRFGLPSMVSSRHRLWVQVKVAGISVKSYKRSCS